MLVTTSPLVKRYTLEEYDRLPSPEGDFKFELIAGVLYLNPTLTAGQVRIQRNLHQILRSAFEAMDELAVLPQVWLRREPATYLEPDLLASKEKHKIRLGRKTVGKAELVVEIISPTSVIYDRNTKADTYAALGVREFWLINPNQKIVEVRNLEPSAELYGSGVVFQGGECLRSQVLPQIALPVDGIFK